MGRDQRWPIQNSDFIIDSSVFDKIGTHYGFISEEYYPYEVRLPSVG